MRTPKPSPLQRAPEKAPRGNVTPREMGVDALRGIAMVWMTGFHFCFDLHYFGYLQTAFYDNPVWTWQRSAIVSLFVFSAGMGQSLATAQGLGWPRFVRRWLQIVGGAALVSVASYAMFPDSFIYFGILHGMALMLLIGRALARWLQPQWGQRRDRITLALLLAGALALALPTLALGLHAHWPAAHALNAPWWNWLGLVSRKPITEDYAPLFPWFGMFLWGLAAGAWWPRSATANTRKASGSANRTAAVRALAWLGRHSLPYYLLHQVVLMGGFMLVRG